jgi:hypothetical protein
LRIAVGDVVAIAKWGSGDFGTPVVVTYGFVTERTVFDGNVRKDNNCRNLVPLAENLPYVQEEDLEAIAAYAFGVWGALSGLRFERVAPGERPDVLLGAQADASPKGFAWADLRVEAGTEDTHHGIIAGAVCFNPLPREEESKEPWAWRVAEDGETLDPHEDVAYMLLHEVGHVIGVDHPGSSGEVMAFKITGNRTITDMVKMVLKFMYGDVEQPSS